MTDVIRISPQKLYEMAGVFHQTAIDIYLLMRELRGDAGPLIEAMRSSLDSSPDALQAVWDKWYQAAISEHDFLDDIAISLGIVAKNFEAVDKKAIPPVNP